MKIHTILPGKLYQSSNLFKVPMETKLQELRAAGIRAVLNVWRHPEWELEQQGISYNFFPLSDSQKQVPELPLANAVSWGYRQLLEGKPLLVHCHAGRNRSALVNACILHKLGMPGGEAVEWVKQARPGSFGSNALFEEYVRRLS